MYNTSFRIKDNQTGQWINRHGSAAPDAFRTEARAVQIAHRLGCDLKPAGSPDGYTIEEVTFKVISNRTNQVVLQEDAVTPYTFPTFGLAKDFIVGFLEGEPSKEHVEGKDTYRIEVEIVSTSPKAEEPQAPEIDPEQHRLSGYGGVDVSDLNLD